MNTEKYALMEILEAIQLYYQTYYQKEANNEQDNSNT